MTPTVPTSRLFESAPAFSPRDAVCAGMMVLYNINYYISYTESRGYSTALGLPPAVLGMLLSATPFFSLFVAVCHGFMREVDYKLPLLYSILMCIAGNVLYSAAKSVGSVVFLAVGRAFLGLGDPTLLLLFYFSVSISGPLMSRCCAKALGVVLAGQGLSWALQANAHYIPFIGQLAAHNIGAVVCAALWTFMLLPFQGYFRTPSVLPHRRDSEVRPEHLRETLLALAAVFLVAAVAEGTVVGAVTTMDEGKVAWGMCAASWVGVLSTLVTVKHRKAGVLATEAVTAAVLLWLYSLERSAIVNLEASAFLPLLVVYVPSGLGMNLLWKVLKECTPTAPKKHLPQAVYMLILSGRIVGCLGTTLSSMTDSFPSVWLAALSSLSAAALCTTAAL